MRNLRKYRTLGLTALTASALLLPLPVMAAENGSTILYEGSNGKCSYKIIAAGKNCNLPGYILPDFIFPDCDVPETELPETPDVEIPEVELPESPETNTPDIELPEAPEADIPDMELPEVPEVETPAPDTNLPENNAPESGTPESDAPEADTPDADSTHHAYIRRIVELVNVERAKEGLSALTLENDMTDAAMVRAKEIQSSFSHTRPNGSSFATALKEAGVSYNRAGENIAWGQRSPEEVVNAWMNSSGHRANIMSASFSRIGVGYLTNASGTPYWVQLFAN